MSTKKILMWVGIALLAYLIYRAYRNKWFNGVSERSNACLGACIDAQTQLGNPDPEGWCRDSNNAGTPPKCNFGGGGNQALIIIKEKPKDIVIDAQPPEV